MFNVPVQLIAQVHLQVAVMDYDLLGRGECLGTCVLGPNKDGTGGEHWNMMISSVQVPVAMWHMLLQD